MIFTVARNILLFCETVRTSLEVVRAWATRTQLRNARRNRSTSRHQSKSRFLVPSRTPALLNFSVYICVQFLARNDESSPDLAGFQILRPDRLTNRPHCTRAVKRGLFDCEKTRNYGLGCYRITRDVCESHCISPPVSAFQRPLLCQHRALHVASQHAPSVLCEGLGSTP